MADLLRIAQATDILSIVRAKGRLFALARVGPDATFGLYSIEGWHLIQNPVKGVRRLNTQEILIRTEEGLELFDPHDATLQKLDPTYIAYDSTCVKDKVIKVTATNKAITVQSDGDCFSFATPQDFQRLSLSLNADKLAVISMPTATHEAPQSCIQVWTIASNTMASTLVSGFVIEAKWIDHCLFLKLNQDDYLSVVSIHGDTLKINSRVGDHVPLEVDAEVAGVKPSPGGTEIDGVLHEWTASSACVDGAITALVTSSPGSSYAITLMEHHQIKEYIKPPYHFEIAHTEETVMLDTRTGTMPSLKITPLTRSNHNNWAVVFHGGPHDTYQGEWNPLLATLLSYGWTILCPNVRGSTGFGKEYAQLQGQWGIADLEDALVSTAYALKHASQVVVIGMSYGSYLAALVGCQLGKEVMGFIGSNGIYSPAELLNSLPPLISAWLQREQVSSKTPDAVELANSSTRGLLIHALNDTVSPVQQAQALAQSIKAHGGQVETLWIGGEGHLITDPINVKEAMAKIVSFVQEVQVHEDLQIE
jgi:predicted esterase